MYFMLERELTPKGDRIGPQKGAERAKGPRLLFLPARSFVFPASRGCLIIILHSAAACKIHGRQEMRGVAGLHAPGRGTPDADIKLDNIRTHHWTRPKGSGSGQLGLADQSGHIAVKP